MLLARNRAIRARSGDDPMGSRLGDKKHRHDVFYQRAKAEKYPARSIYKLEEIDKRFKLLEAGQCVLDLGCRPGSWMQYALKKVGKRGAVIGVDRTELEIEIPNNGKVVVQDIFDLDPAVLDQELAAILGKAPASADVAEHIPFDVVLSDMAPDTTGIAFTDQVRSVELFARALGISVELGRPGGSFVGKIFMGSGFDDAIVAVKKAYKRHKTLKPEATRKESKELFIVALDRR
jgi:23S rRNA (uridine2552-2'-O)-methyltransferase